MNRTKEFHLLDKEQHTEEASKAFKMALPMRWLLVRVDLMLSLGHVCQETSDSRTVFFLLVVALDPRLEGTKLSELWAPFFVAGFAGAFLGAELLWSTR